MSWIELKHSKRSVRRAGDFLINPHENFDLDKFLESYNVLENWRSSHAYPIQSMLGYFRKKAFEADKDSIVARRLKRTPSILAKLRREKGMKLDRMEDIGGCRIVVSNISQVYEVKNSIVDGSTRNTLRRLRNYIKEPKESGYRGIHIVYRYNGEKNNTHPTQLNSKLEVRISIFGQQR